MDKCEKNLERDRLTEFPALKDHVYLDHAGTTLASRSQLDGFHSDMLSNLYGNPHSHSPSSQLTSDTVDQIRFRVLQYFNTSPEEYSVIFTSGCTASLKLIAELFDFQGNERCHGDKRCPNDSCQITENISNQMTTDSNPVIHQLHNIPEIPPNTCDHNYTQLGRNVEEGQQKSIGQVSSNKAHVKYVKGSFTYLVENHTSVQGMRQLALSRAGQINCIGCDCHGNTLDSKVKVLYQHEVFRYGGNNLFAYPAQSNYSGWKYPLEWTEWVKTRKMRWQRSWENQGQGHCHGNSWYILLDAAALVSTSPLNLGSTKPDFVTFSFYKMFGFPTGLGALIVRNKSSHVLKKSYFGGGTVAVSLPTELFHVSRSSLCDSLEDGTVSFLDIISLRHGFDALESLGGGISSISQHTFTIAKYFYDNLTLCCHGNGSPLAEVYTYGEFDDITKQGAIVNFNLKRANGDYIGFANVDTMAQLHNIHVRTGCFCNIGACQIFLQMTDDQIKQNFEAGHECGDNNDLIDGRPTGSVRVSFGYMSSIQDAQICLQVLVDCFLENTAKPVFHKHKTLNQSNDALKYISQPNCTKKPLQDDSGIHIEGSRDGQKPSSSKFYPSAGTRSDQKKILTENLHIDLDKTTLPSLREMGETRLEKRFSRFGIENDYKEGEDAVELFSPCSGKHLSEICLYPIKSCAAFKVLQWPLGRRGLLYDREWMVVTESGIAMSQKRERMLCLLQPSIDLSRDVLRIEFPGMEPVDVPLQNEDTSSKSMKLCNSRVCGDRVQSMDCGDAVADWLSRALHRPGCRLIRQGHDDKRASKLSKYQEKAAGEGGQLSLANVAQYLLISKDSAISLHSRMQNNEDSMVDTQGPSVDFDINNLLDRFRGNLVVSGCEPFEEDNWASVQIGNIKFTGQGPCTRCQMICLDPKTGQKSTEPLKSLQQWPDRKVTFGTLLCADTDGQRPKMELRVGDPVFPEMIAGTE